MQFRLFFLLWFNQIMLVAGLANCSISSLAASTPEATETSDSEQVQYRLSFESADHHFVNVTARFPKCKIKQEFYLPVWTPGSYLIREHARHIDSLQALDSNNQALEVKKISKNRWLVDRSAKKKVEPANEEGSKTDNSDDTDNSSQVAHAANDTIEIRYRVYCNELTVRTNFVDREFALLNGAALFLTREQDRARDQRVACELPANWQQAVTALERSVEIGPHTFLAHSFDELVDSPIVLGNPTLHPFRVGGVEHYLVNLGDGSLWDGEKAAADLAKIVETHQRMWGIVPYENYFFLNLIAEGGGGLEHDNSTVMLTSRWSFRTPRRYQGWLGLASHEFFHTWNVRRLRPKALVSYDYEVENYFEELWVAEGVTSYYDELALVRSGLSSVNSYLAALSKQIDTLETTQGRFHQSLAGSSQDTWVKFYRPHENSRNMTISYYNKGAVVAFLLDIEIRKATDNSKSLDDVMRGLYQKFAGKDGFTNADVVAEVNALTNSDWSDWFQRTIYSTEGLEYQPALDWLGLKFTHQTKDTASDLSKTPSDKSEPVWTGINTRLEDGKLVVTSVVENSPGYQAGVNVDDEVIAVQNYRVSSNFTDVLNQFSAVDPIELLIARRGRLLRLSLRPGERPELDWKLQRLPQVSDQQKSSLNLWLHQPQPADSGS